MSSNNLDDSNILKAKFDSIDLVYFKKFTTSMKSRDNYAKNFFYCSMLQKRAYIALKPQEREYSVPK
jgi:hypothetical protein